MREKGLAGILPVILLVCVGSASALEPAACRERLKSVDERIASGKYSDQNVQVAQQMRGSIMQSCAYLDEATIAQMMEGFEQLLPSRSAAEREAYEESRRADRKAKRETQRAELEVKRAERARFEEERRKLEAQKPPVPAVLKQPPTGKSKMGRFVDRDDAMHNIAILDWDHNNEKARILYETNPLFHSDPALNQSNLAEAARHYYVVEMDDSGNRMQHHVRKLPLDRHAVVALRPGHDELVVQWRRKASPGPESSLERWSISTGETLSSVETPELPWSRQQWNPLNEVRMTTTDGDVLFVGSRPVGRGDKAVVEWLKASPDGQIVGQGILQSDVESVTLTDWIRTRDGGAGLVIFVRNFDDSRGIKSELKPPVHNVGGVDIKGVVFSEQRLLIIDSNGRIAGQSSALERQLGWDGLDKLGQLGSMDAMQEASELTSRDGARYGETVSVRSYSARGRNVEAVAAVGDGYGVLVSVNSAGTGQPLLTGDWLHEYSIDKTVRKTYLEPAGEHLGARFQIVAGTDDDSVYLFTRGGENGAHVVKLGEDREFNAYGKLSMSSKTQPRGMLADRKGVWVIGDGSAGGRLDRVWLERVNFD